MPSKSEGFLAALIIGVVAACFTLGMFIAAFDSADDMAKCQKEFSYDVCAYALR